MKSKHLNNIMLVCLILFSIIFGVSAGLRAKRIADLDKEYDQNMQEDLQNRNDEWMDNITPPSPNPSEKPDVKPESKPFTSFVEMYNSAEGKLAHTTNIYSSGTGRALFNSSVGNGNGTITFKRGQNLNQSMFTFSLDGNLSGSLGNIKIGFTTAFYNEGATSNEFKNGEWSAISRESLQSKYQWKTNQTFPTINSLSVSSSSFFKDPTTKAYSGEATLIPSVSAGSLKYTMKAFMNATKPVEYISSKIKVKLNPDGTFKEITYMDKFQAELHDEDSNKNISVTVNTTYTETFMYGNVNIKSPITYK